MKTNLKSVAVSLLLPLCILYGGDARAQERKLFRNPVPGKHDFAVEVGLLPGGGKIIDLGHFSSKFYLSDKYAVRLGVEFDIHRADHVKTDDVQYGFMTISERSDYWGFNAGVEKRLISNGRVSPYVGIDIHFGRRISSGKYVSRSSAWSPLDNDILATTEVTGVIRLDEESFDEPVWYIYDRGDYYYNPGFTSFGVNLVFGTDFYIMRHVYLGFEFGFGFKRQKYDRIEIYEWGYFTIPYERFITSPATMSIGFNLNNALRVGIWF